MPWKLNLIDVSPDGSKLFCASHNNLIYYDLINEDQATLVYTYKIQGRPDWINQLKCTNIDGLWCIVTVCTSGFVNIHYMDDLTMKPISLRNTSDTWSLASCPTMPYVIVGANSHNITFFDLSQSEPASDAPQLTGHTHNIPSVDISPCGKFIVSVSVDFTIKIWDQKTGHVLVENKLPQWGWGVKFIRKDSIVDAYIPNSVDCAIMKISGIEFDEPYEDIYNMDMPTIERPLSDSSEPMSELIGGSDTEEDDFDWVDEEEEEEETHAIEDIRTMKMPEKPIMNNSNQEILKRLELSTLTHPNGPFMTSPSLLNQESDASLSDYLVIASTQDSLILFDSNLEVLASVAKVLDRPYDSPFGLFPMIRLSIVQYIPELSLLLVANQGAFSLLVFTIRFNLNTNEYEYIPELKLPQQKVESTVIGLCYHQVEKAKSYNVYLMFQTGVFMAYQIQLNEEDQRYNIETIEV